MSGGVDSSVAAARLVAAGHDVVGVTLHLWDYPDDGQVKGRCCAPEDVHDARRVCDALSIPYFAFDRRELFQREVVGPFVDAYLEGETPSPCVRCNRGVKLRELLQLADRLGASHVATGHYARIREHAGRPALFRARDLAKDQSYFLHMLDAATLGRLMFPLGDATKAEIRAEAETLALPGATKGESQELCFVPRGRYDALVSSRAGDRVTKGQLVDQGGRVLAEHDGIHRFTVGQRKNLGVAAGKRLYVVRVDRGGTVELGPREQLLADRAKLAEVALATGQAAPFDCQAVVRYRGTPQPAKLANRLGEFQLEFAEPLHAIVPGQVAVMYDGDRVLGGGTIQRSWLHSSEQEPKVASPPARPEPQP
ncbi:MAG: tRNA 2-thiouridine(34) synthase MnmA [Polyangiaceae bacterium]|nr:tRNA 2-thiouridine(34) synthase MnmA [Myxococcales bacterium]MCB9590064.1 tRNA 2-thiouridine(34) synthase MnmA [Polyangiaceae bacterium]